MTIAPPDAIGPWLLLRAIAALKLAPVFALGALALLLSAACTDLPSASELSHPQVLAVRARPATLPYGQRAALDYLVVGPEGPLQVSAEWSASGASSIEVDAEGATWLRAPSSGPGRTLTPLDVTFTGAGQPTLRARKLIALGAAEALQGPTLAQLRIGDVALDAGDSLTLRAGQRTQLGLVLADGSAGEQGAVAWYSTLGEIDGYRSATAELYLPEQSAEGWLYAVYRDRQGGVDWASLRLRVQ